MTGSLWIATAYRCPKCGAGEVKMMRYGAMPSDSDSDIKFRCQECRREWWLRNESPLEPEGSADE